MKPIDPKHVEKAWREFSKTIPKDAPKVQLVECKGSFLAGYYSMMNDLFGLLNSMDNNSIEANQAHFTDFMNSVKKQTESLFQEHLALLTLIQKGRI